MIVAFAYPSSGQVTGGEAVLYELANGLARRGHTVNFLHGPGWARALTSLDDLPELCRRAGVVHVLADRFDDPGLPASDVVFAPEGSDRLGLPAHVVQGYKMLSPEWERDVFRAPGPKFCVATWLQDVGEEFGVPRHQMLHLPPGLDHDRFALRHPLGDRPIDVAVLHHPHREKGWALALALLTRLVARRPDVRVTVFGRRTPRRLPPGVRFVDSPDHARLADEIYGRARVFVQTSGHEGFGLTPVEAMACGAALVSTDCGGSRDYAFPDETALVTPPGDPDALVAAVERLLDDEALRLRLAAAGERHVRTFRWERSAEILEHHLERYLADPAPFLEPPADRLPDDWEASASAGGAGRP